MRLQHNKMGRQRRRVTGRDRTHRVLPSGYGEERDGAGEASSSQGARPSGGCAARHGEHGPGSSGVVGPALSQRLGQTGDAGPRGAGGPSELVATIEPLLSAVAALKSRQRARPGCGGPGTGEGRSGEPLANDRARRRAGDGAGLRGHCRRCRAWFAKSRAVGAYVGLTSRRWQSGEMDYSGRISKTRRRHAAQPALRGRQQFC